MGQSGTVSIALEDSAATAELAARLAAGLPADTSGWLILLQGELGSGKSTLARAMLHALGHNAAVPSPTYTLVEPYHLPDRDVFHVDLYRISDVDELTFLGWDDLRDGLLLVEWPERAAHLASEADLLIELDYQGQGRSARISALSERGTMLLDSVISQETTLSP